MDINAFYAHKNEQDEFQTVNEHLKNTSMLAESFAHDDFKALAKYAGLLHDIGKYRDGFQRRINGDNIRCEHASCGAQEVLERLGKSPASYLLAFCISGHHTGLQDGGSTYSEADEPTLHAALNRDVDDYKKHAEHFQFTPPDTKNLMTLLTKQCPPKDNAEVMERFAFFTRYLYSCLTDADFIDTERFCNPAAERGIDGDFKAALELVDKKLQGFVAKTPLQMARNLLQQQAFSNSDKNEISLLNMPTGSGKTLCSIKLALERAVSAGKKRIIYVIPYTSIIEQTADEFNSIFGEVLPVVQHHSNYTYKDVDSEDNTTAQKLKRTCENYDAPLIITTNVQLFQSMYHNKSSRLRKLHNLADSVIVFDEIHMMPTDYLQPCLRGIGYLTAFLNSEAILLSATMPYFEELFSRYIKMGTQKSLITDTSHFSDFDKCTYHYLGECAEEKILGLSDDYKSSLIIVNSRKLARELYKKYQGKKFHLSTYMTPIHRSEKIRQIRECLSNNEKITVVSTSLIEAGVDLDFETVFREISGLDSILQSGGRCNREGKRDNGDVYIFSLPSSTLHGELGIKANISRELLKSNATITSAECISEYYKRLYAFGDEQINRNSIANGVENIRHMPFRSYTEQFKFIDSDTISIIVPCADNERLVESVKFGGKSALRELQKYSASVHFHEFSKMLESGMVQDIGGAFALTDPRFYDSDTGLSFEYTSDTDNII